MIEKQNTLTIGSTLQGTHYNYLIEKVLGQGSFGITYLASTEIEGPLGKITVPVALKEFFMGEVNGREGSSVTSSANSGLYDKYRRKFIGEAQSLSRLHHPNIIHVLETFEANNTVYYSMEYLDGGSLDGLIKQRGRLPEEEALPIIRQVADALRYMHSQHMLHLDLKPANIMLGKQGQPVLIDFGLSKQYDDEGNPESSTTVGGGTPGYAPLEQSNYRGHDGRSPLPVTMDVYALGATLFKMLTGQRPPDASELMNEGFPEEELSHVSEPVRRLVEQAMHPMRKQRTPSAEAFLQALPSQQAAAPRGEEGTRYVEPQEEGTRYDAPAPEPTPQPQPEPKKESKPEPKSDPYPHLAPMPEKKNRTALWLGLGAAVVLIATVLLFVLPSAPHEGEGTADSVLDTIATEGEPPTTVQQEPVNPAVQQEPAKPAVQQEPAKPAEQQEPAKPEPTVTNPTAPDMSVKVDGVWIGALKYNIAYGKATVANQDHQASGRIEIPSSVTYNGRIYPVTRIGNSSFSWCKSLTSVSIPSSVTSIGEAAFYGCESLTSVSIPSSVNSIGKRAFGCCESLTSVSIPSSVTSIGDEAFGQCSSLTTVSIPNSVTSIGIAVFYSCKISEPIYHKNMLIYVPASYQGHFNIRPGTTSINGAFSGCKNLTSVSIPNSVTSLGNGAFAYCYRLTSVSIPSSVNSIGESAFGFCSSLRRVEIKNPYCDINKDAFRQCPSNLQIIR